MGSKIEKISYYLPEKITSNDDLQKEFSDFDSAKFSKKIGISSRHITGDNETALDIAFKAATEVLLDENKETIDFVLYCTQSPEYFLPSGACLLQNRLGLSSSCGALDFNLGCSGFVYGLSLCKGLISSGVAKRILFVTSETYSKHLHPKDKANRGIFGDAATATIVAESEKEHIGEFVLGTDGSGAEKLIVRNGCSYAPFNEDTPAVEYGTGNITDDNHIYMDGPGIFNFTIEKVPFAYSELLRKNDLELENVQMNIFHQANKYMLNYLRKKIKISKDHFYIDMNDVGNTVSNTIPIALKRALDKDVVNVGDKVSLVGFGVGLSWAGVIVEL